MSDPHGVDPEEALVAAISSCHMLWFLDLARRDGLNLLAYRDAAYGEMGRNEAGRPALARIILQPQISVEGEAPDAAQLADLHARAHARCFIATSLNSEVLVVPQVTLVDGDSAALARPA